MLTTNVDKVILQSLRFSNFSVYFLDVFQVVLTLFFFAVSIGPSQNLASTFGKSLH
jgi:hypothetical protein